MPLTTARAGLDTAELLTTAAAAAMSTALYLRFDGPYLARGVVGDVVGFTALAVPLVVARRRARHEALVCLAGIAVVHLTSADWPLALPSAVWWAVVTVTLGGYLAARRRLLAAAAPAGG